MKRRRNDEKGFVLLETVIVSVFIISIFTFVYTSIVPLLGRYEELAYEYDIDIAYKLYHIRDAMYKDANFTNIVGSKYKRVTSADFNDTTYFNSLVASLFEDSYEIVYIKELKNRVDGAISGLGITGGFKEYIEKTAKTKADAELENFIFLKEENNYAYLGLATDLNNLTNYQEPEIVDLKNHTDTSGANQPILMDGMIPVYYSEDELSWKKADSTNQSSYYYWYDYNELRWANVVLVKENVRDKYINASVDSEININDVIAFYVWIPRFEYSIQGTYGKNGTSASLPGEITVNFITTDISKTRSYNSYTWRTASAFTFGTVELDGFWFAKFEMSNSELKGYTLNGTGIPYILPDTYSWIGQKIAQAYSKITTYMNGTNGKTIYGLKSSSGYASDAHLMKNEEWGAVAYLSQSQFGKYNNDNFEGFRKEVYINNRQDLNTSLTITGSSAGEPSVATTALVNRECSSSASNVNAGCYKYFVENLGTGASTTGTIYGIYDMSGGQNEVIMGAGGTTTAYCGSKIYVGYYTEFSGFKGPYGYTTSTCNDDANDLDFPTDTKYYTLYRTGTLSRACVNSSNVMTTCYSHAMSETSGWYDDVAATNSKESPWYLRGGQIAVSSGIFAISPYNGSTSVENVVNANFATRPTIAVYALNPV